MNPGVDERFVLGSAYALMAAIVAVTLDVWLGAGLAALVAGHGWSPALEPDLLLRLLVEGDEAVLVPGSPRWLAYTVVTVLALAELVGGIAAWRWLADVFRGWRDPSHLARPGDLGELAGKAAAAKAIGLRPSLRSYEPKTLPPNQIGLPLLYVHRRPVYMSWEDVGVAIMGPRVNKTSALVVPAILSCPGPVVATSNKADVWTLTHQLRAAMGPVWTFDPQLVGYIRQTWYCDPISWVRAEHPDWQYAQAQRVIGHFVSTISGERSDPFFSNAARRVAVGAVLAAAAMPDGTLRNTLEFLGDQRMEAIHALDAHGLTQDAAELEKTVGGADVTAEGIYETARTALGSLRNEALLRWVTPPHTWRTPPDSDQHIECFDPWQLLAPGPPPTLFLLSKEDESSSAPVVTMLVDRVVEVAERAAQARGGRLDPSLSLVLDEAANICPIQNMPKLFSHLGSRGCQCLVILQSYPQGVKVWGKEGMDALWSASTAKLVGGGLEEDDAHFLSRLSTGIGERYAHQPSSISRDRRGGGSESWGMGKEAIMPVSTLRRLSKKEALLITQARPIALGQLRPWYRHGVPGVADVQTISAADKAAKRIITENAAAHLARNPLAAAVMQQQEAP